MEKRKTQSMLLKRELLSDVEYQSRAQADAILVPCICKGSSYDMDLKMCCFEVPNA